MGGWQWFVWGLAVICMGGWQWFVWESGGGLYGTPARSDLYGGLAVVCMEPLLVGSGLYGRLAVICIRGLHLRTVPSDWLILQ